MDRHYFFIIGAPRSGTTMLQMALNRHPRVLIPPETHYFTLPARSRRGQLQHWRRIQNDLGVDVPPPERRVRRDRSARGPFVRLLDSYAARYSNGPADFLGDKSNTHTRRVPLILECFPEARLILIDRDGRDVALSLSKVPWMPPNPDVGFALWLNFQRTQWRLLNDFLGKVHHIKYEDLVRDPETYLRRVLEFLGLDYDPTVAHGSGNRVGILDSEMEFKGRAREPITAARIGCWRSELSLEQIERFEQWGGDTLQKLGYAIAPGRKAFPAWRRALCYAPAAAWVLNRRARLFLDEHFETRFAYENRRPPAAWDQTG